MKRTPSLRFERDDSIERGVAVETVLAELAKERVAAPADEPAEPDPDDPEVEHAADDE